MPFGIGGVKMPMGDGTGPNGMGSMTGRRRGYCSGFNELGFMNPSFGRGFGGGRGFGFRAGFNPQMVQPQVITEAEEKRILQEDLEILKQEMTEIQKRLKEFK